MDFVDSRVRVFASYGYNVDASQHPAAGDGGRNMRRMASLVAIMLGEVDRIQTMAGCSSWSMRRRRWRREIPCVQPMVIQRHPSMVAGGAAPARRVLAEEAWYTTGDFGCTAAASLQTHGAAGQNGCATCII